MSSPAERFARARRRNAAPRLAEFSAQLDFPLDDFQERACRALEAGRGVLVAAPTGAGKTVVGEFAAHLALAAGRKAFYTTPIKALSNQKYADLARRHGADRVGLLTGDTSVNGEAPVVVMTTEVLRNMLYAGSATLAGLGYVVMDEVHYLADRFRGAVWEEVIIHLPDDVAVVSLSATVSNAEEFGAWLGEVRGPTEVVVEEHRPVPLWQHMLLGRQLFDLFVDDREGAHPAEFGQPRGARVESAIINPDLLEAVRGRRAAGDHRGRLEDAGGPRGRRGRARGAGGPGRSHRPTRGDAGGRERAYALDHTGPRRSGPGPRPGTATRAEVVALLDREGLLPAITFIFSRAGCDAAVRQLLAAGTWLVDGQEAESIRRLVEARVAGIAVDDLAVLGYWDFLEGLTRGFAAHHAGMIPTFRETVEELFVQGRVRAVFATETLALGINMPARTVVLEKLVKFNGETHADITPAEYTQLTGRAGRRGIDVEGHAVVLWNPRVDPLVVGGLASTRTYPLRSSFTPTYNMTVNLIARVGRERARSFLQASFAQFQADRAVVGLTRQIREHELALAGYAEAVSCDLGDIAEYLALRRDITAAEKGAARGRGAARREAVPRSTAGEAERSAPPGHVDAHLAQLRRRMRAHPCHHCPDREQHARWSERYHRLHRETEGLRRKVAGRTDSVARTFERLAVILTELGYLQGAGEDTRVTPEGRRLARLYTERDLLAAQCLRAGAWARLDPPNLAAVVSCLIHEPRREETGAATRMPGGAVVAAHDAMVRLWSDLQDREAAHGLALTAYPDPGIAWMVHRWASGARLEVVLRDGDVAAGDFVRRCKQTVDLLDQIAQVAAEPGVRGAARRAVDALMRGVVAADRLD